MGKGLGFQKKVGDALDQEKIEKVFALTDEVKGPLEQVLREIPYEHVHMANRIIHQGKKALNKDLNKNIYVTLTDHLNYAIERAKKGRYSRMHCFGK
jgi:beta-glucoside operon transcriptional antiterminator